jgi:hypothetical protein
VQQSISEYYDGRAVNTLLVMSDDPEVARQAAAITRDVNNPLTVIAIVQDGMIDRVSSKQKCLANNTHHSMLFCETKKGEPLNIEDDKMRAMVFLMASLELFSRCQGMVGNWESNVSALLYQMMVYRHARCLPYFTFSKQWEWRPLA